MKYIAYLIAALLMEVAGVPAAIFLPFWCKLSWKPWAWPFATPDNPPEGDAGWLFLHWQWRYKLPRLIGDYIGRMGWLLRNRAYGFKWHSLAVEITHTPTYRGDPEINRNNARFGLLRCWHGDAWQWKWVHPLKRWHLLLIGWTLLAAAWLLHDACLSVSATAVFVAFFFAREGVYCWMLNFGWLLDAYIGNPALKEKQPRALFMFSPRICTIHWPSKL